MEWRIDLDPAIASTEKPSILTVREEDPAVWLGVVQRYSGYDYLDVPLEIAEALGKQLPAKPLIISYHNFDGMPSDEELNALWWRMRAFGQIVKIACMVEDGEQAWRLHQLFRGRPNTIVVPMGDVGTPLRVWEGLHTPLWSYASLGEPVAPGQLSLQQLEERYRMRDLGKKVKCYGLIGDPVTFSKSDLTHNARLQQMGEDAVYLKIRLPKEKARAFRNWPVEGLSVTMPLKEAVMPFVDRLDPAVKEIGALNTLVKRRGEWWGFNTDGIGALNVIGEVSGQRVVILGGGGTARAIAYEAKRRGAHVCVMTRRQVPGLGSVPIGDPGPYDVLVNATSVGMTDDKSLVAPEWLRAGSTVLECVSSQQTRLMREAREAGCRVIGGYKMFLAQADEQFKLWFDR